MKDQAIALCRVSTPEQLQNNSLNRQDEAIEKCAAELRVEIVRKWSGDVSTKRGKNVKRTDLREMLEFCRKNRRVGYLLIDEPDRFMRSIKEAFYFETEFEKLDVKVWYASDSELNNDDLMAKMYRFMKYFTAEGSNEERINKSISGGKKAIREGRLPSHPKNAYMKGPESGIHLPDEPVSAPFQQALKMMASHTKVPTDALKWLMSTEFGKRHPRYRMDKFRRHACDPYYYGVVELKGKFNERNENGLHEPLITKEEHERILRVFDKNVKKQQGYRPDKETEYPLSNQLTCIMCDTPEHKYPRFTSVPLNNGRTNQGKPRRVVRYYAKYKCRECNRYIDRDETHISFAHLLSTIVLPRPDLERLREKLVEMFDTKHHHVKGEVIRLEAKNISIQQRILEKVEAATDPAYAYIKEEIQTSIQQLKAELSTNEEKMILLKEQHEADLAEFLDFSFDFLGNKGTHFFRLSVEDMKRCKQLIFTDKIYVDSKKNVYTNSISRIFGVATTKKDALTSNNDPMVRVPGL